MLQRSMVNLSICFYYTTFTIEEDIICVFISALCNCGFIPVL